MEVQGAILTVAQGLQQEDPALIMVQVEVPVVTSLQHAQCQEAAAMVDHDQALPEVVDTTNPGPVLPEVTDIDLLRRPGVPEVMAEVPAVQEAMEEVQAGVPQEVVLQAVEAAGEEIIKPKIK